MTSLEKTILKFYFYHLFKSADVKRGIFILYWLSLGFSHTQIGILQMTLFWSTFLSEIPTGLLADRWSRRLSMGLGAFFCMLYGFGYMAFTSYGALIILASFLGIGFSLFSGADQAYLYDYLKAHNQESLYVRIQGRAKAVSSLSLAAAIGAGGYLQSFGWQIVFGTYTAFMFLGLFVVFLLPSDTQGESLSSEKHSEENVERPRPWRDTLVLLRSRDGKRLSFLLIALGLFEAAYTPYFIFSQSLFQNVSISAKHSVWLFSIVELGTSLSYYFASVWANRFSLKKLTFSTFLVIPLLLGTNLLGNPVLCAVAFMIAMLFPNVMFLATESYIHDKISSQIRSTYLSVASFVQSLFVSIAYLALGSAMDHYSPPIAIGLLAVFPLVGLLFLMPFFRRQCGAPQ